MHYSEIGMAKGSYKIMELELASLASVRKFAQQLKAYCSGRTLDALVRLSSYHLHITS
jgi:hypothetical protein